MKQECSECLNDFMLFTKMVALLTATSGTKLVFCRNGLVVAYTICFPRKSIFIAALRRGNKPDSEAFIEDEQCTW